MVESTDGRSAEAIRADLERARAELAASVVDLKVALSRKVDAREWYRRHTALFLIGAFTVGFLAGLRRRS
ncbi:MAG: DUF3618 domain-containing protein [Myxococcaceae bacterium]|nr:DUF3618 domain-containing protein [Myxococcaceae bacterium]